MLPVHSQATAAAHATALALVTGMVTVRAELMLPAAPLTDMHPAVSGPVLTVATTAPCQPLTMHRLPVLT